MDDPIFEIINNERIQKIITNFWRNTNINVLGYGNQGRRLVEELAYICRSPLSKIKGINVWVPNFRDGKIENYENDFHQRFNFLLTHSGGSEDYEKIMNLVKFNGFNRLNDLSSIVDNARDDEYNADLLIIASRYKFDMLFSDKFPKSKLELKEIEKFKLMRLIQSNIFNAPYDYDACVNLALNIQKKQLNLEQLITDFQKDRGINQGRLNMLSSNIIGITELGKVIKQYPGTVINIVNDVNITNYALAAEAKLSINRIVGPSSNDFARLQVLLREVYKYYFAENFQGEIKVPTLKGPHGGTLVFEREKIYFNNKSFNQIFGEDADSVYEKVKEDLFKYGMSFAKRNNRSCEDTVFNSLQPVILSVITDDSNIYRGSVFNRDFNAFTGLDFRIQRGNIFSDADTVSNLNQEVIGEFIEGTRIVQELTNLLVEEGYFPKISSVKSVLREIPPTNNDCISSLNSLLTLNSSNYEVINELIEQYSNRIKHASDSKIFELKKELTNLKTKKDIIKTLKHKLVMSLNSEIYFLSNLNMRSFTKVSFKHTLNPFKRHYDLNLKGKVSDDRLSHENNRLKLLDFIVKNNFVYALSERKSRGIMPTEYRIFRYDSKLSYITEPLILDKSSKEFNLEDMIVTDNELIYVLIKNKNEKFIAKVEPNTSKLIEITKVKKDIRSICAYNNNLILYSENVLYLFDGTTMNDIYESKEGIYDARICEKQDLIFFSHSYQDVSIIDINSNREKKLKSDLSIYDFHYDSNGLQIATLQKENITIFNYLNKDELFSVQTTKNNYILEDLIFSQANILIPTRNVLLVMKEPNELYALYHELISGQEINKHSGFFIQSIDNFQNFSTIIRGMKKND